MLEVIIQGRPSEPTAIRMACPLTGYHLSFLQRRIVPCSLIAQKALFSPVAKSMAPCPGM